MMLLDRVMWTNPEIPRNDYAKENSTSTKVRAEIKLAKIPKLSLDEIMSKQMLYLLYDDLLEAHVLDIERQPELKMCYCCG